MVSADGGQPGTNTSTGTTSCSGRTNFSSGGTPSVGGGCMIVAFSLYTVSMTAVRPQTFRIDGTLPVTAQSPSATTVVAWSRTLRAFARSSSLLTEPSTSAMSTCSGNCFRSTSGEYTKSACSSTVRMRSSMSRNDMWQPEQPSSQIVASVGLLMT